MDLIGLTDIEADTIENMRVILDRLKLGESLLIIHSFLVNELTNLESTDLFDLKNILDGFYKNVWSSLAELDKIEGNINENV